MLIATIRPLEARTVEVTAATLDGIQQELRAHQSAGFDLVSAPVRMLKGEQAMTAVGTFKRVDGVREIAADNMTSLEAKVPEGWQMLTVRRS